MGIAIAATSYPHRKKEVENSFQNIYNTEIEADTRGSGNEVEMTVDDIHDKGVSTGGTDCRKVVLEVEKDREQRIKQEKVKEEKKKDREVGGNVLDRLLCGGKGGSGGIIIEGENEGVKDEEEENTEDHENEHEQEQEEGDGEEEEEDLSDEAVEARHEGMLKSMRDRWATLQKLRMERKYALLGIPFNWDEGVYVCVYVCACNCVLVCMCMCMLECVCMYVCVRVCMFVRMYVCLCVCMFVCVSVYWCVCLSVCGCVCLSAC